MPEGALDSILPAPAPLVNYLTGEIVDRDDYGAVVANLAQVEEWITREVYDKHRQLFRCRDALRARQGELKPTDLPRRRDQSKQQQLIERCPRCRTRLPRTIVREAD